MFCAIKCRRADRKHLKASPCRTKGFPIATCRQHVYIMYIGFESKRWRFRRNAVSPLFTLRSTVLKALPTHSVRIVSHWDFARAPMQKAAQYLASGRSNVVDQKAEKLRANQVACLILPTSDYVMWVPYHGAEKMNCMSCLNLWHCSYLRYTHTEAKAVVDFSHFSDETSGHGPVESLLCLQPLALNSFFHLHGTKQEIEMSNIVVFLLTVTGSAFPEWPRKTPTNTLLNELPISNQIFFPFFHLLLSFLRPWHCAVQSARHVVGCARVCSCQIWALRWRTIEYRGAIYRTRPKETRPGLANLRAARFSFSSALWQRRLGSHSCA